MTPTNRQYTLEERLAMAAQSVAASPEHAVALVQHLSQLSGGYAFCGTDDVHLLDSFTRDIWEQCDINVDTYRTFCRFYELLKAKDNKNTWYVSRPEDLDPCQPIWGTRINNAIVLLGEVMLDQAMGRRYQEMYHCLHQTVGQYLDALASPLFHRSADHTKRFQTWKHAFLRDLDPGTPMAEALARIFRRYMAAFQTIDHLDHILTCLAGVFHQVDLQDYHFSLDPNEDILDTDLELDWTQHSLAESTYLRTLRRYGIGRERRYLPGIDLEDEDPFACLWTLANTYQPDLPDPGADMECRTLRTQIFLPYRAYRKDILQKLLEDCPYPDYQGLLEKYFTVETVAAAMGDINRAVSDLYMLLVEPYLHMEESYKSGNFN